MILPARAQLVALSLWAAGAIAIAVEPGLTTAWWGLTAALLLWLVLDAIWVWADTLPEADRQLHKSLALGEWALVELRLRWARARHRRVILQDHMPPGFEYQGLPVAIRYRDGVLVQTYRVRPLSRGNHLFDGLSLRLRSPLAAWHRQITLPLQREVRVYPNFGPLTRHALHAVDDLNARMGLQVRRRRGQGMDFAQLREYREGDSLRQIDWKASTRLGKMISREYQDERDQRVILMIDCGRRMGARDDALSHFDHALDASLMLAWVALRHGDRVGLMTLGGPERFMPVQHHSGTVSTLLDMVYDLQPSMQSSDFERAAQQLLARERKRALVILLTNLRDEDDANLLAATRLLRKRHLVMVASLRESALDDVLDTAVTHVGEAALLGAATDYRRHRNAAFRRLRAEGVLSIDVPPEKLAIETINRYLAVKAARQL
ncbi:DUF58 domain-containing protein [Viridibacterium curvum]|uniref:DUF58 domain-containing protein n=1 Tax=Viridibacterium curvum TaxID=1101404 RepID=A0ABP9QJH6_9RHOO